MLVHIWACEIRDDCDMMRCGLIIYFAPDSSILGPDDFVLEEGDGATCGDCVRASTPAVISARLLAEEGTD